ncbi:uncharacterized protein zgc:113176 [Sardina pilchardus]|uniref:uncharacterized protein zgc:113176 n=1 Tax=Sardina pilchardus TaxID=27697 RepID=UPI002E12A514
MAHRERTKISEAALETLKKYFNEGMSRVGSSLISEAANETGLETRVIENWIGNYKRVLGGPSQPQPVKMKCHVRQLSAYNLFCRDLLKNKGSMSDIKEQWALLGKEEREKYVLEATASRSLDTEQLSPEMREDKIKRHLKQLKLEVAKLELLGVETAIMSIDKSSSSLEVFEVCSKEATVFLDNSDTSSNFALHFKASPTCTSHLPNEHIRVLRKKVQDLFNQKYKEAGGAGRLPYKSLLERPIVVSGLPDNLQLKKPLFYGRNQLEAILKVHNGISFQIDKLNQQ